MQQEGIGSLTGNQEYTQAGTQLKDQARDEMRQAAQQQGGTNTDTSTLTGKAEDALGKAVGCEGMQADQETSDTQVGQVDKYATTHGEH